MSVELVKRVKLTAGSPTEQRLLDYLESNASEVLAEKINAGKKTLGGALRYAKEEARKLSNGSSCIYVADETVFGWVIHFFEEDEVRELKKGRPRGSARTPGKVKKAPQKKAPQKKAVCPERKEGPLVLDLFTGEEVPAR